MSAPAEPYNQIPDRTRCPTCGASRRGEVLCRRCKSDLTLLIRLEHCVDQLRLRARRCYARGWYRRAAAVADRVVSLESRPEDLQLLACARLMWGDFVGAADGYCQTRRQTSRIHGGIHDFRLQSSIPSGCDSH